MKITDKGTLLKPIIIKDVDEPITISGAENIVIEGNVISPDNRKPIEIFSGKSITIRDGKIAGQPQQYAKELSPCGISVKAYGDVRGLAIENCEITNCKYGIDVYRNKLEAVIKNMLIANNKITGLPSSCIKIAETGLNEPDNVRIEGNTLADRVPMQEELGGRWTHGSGIAIRSDCVTMRENVIHNVGPYGIRCYQGVYETGGYHHIKLIRNWLYNMQGATVVELLNCGHNIEIIENTIIGKPSKSFVNQAGKYDMGLKLTSCESGGSVLLKDNTIAAEVEFQMPFNQITSSNNTIWGYDGENTLVGNTIAYYGDATACPEDAMLQLEKLIANPRLPERQILWENDTHRLVMESKNV